MRTLYRLCSSRLHVIHLSGQQRGKVDRRVSRSPQVPVSVLTDANVQQRAVLSPLLAKDHRTQKIVAVRYHWTRVEDGEQVSGSAVYYSQQQRLGRKAKQMSWKQVTRRSITRIYNNNVPEHECNHAVEELERGSYRAEVALMHWRWHQR